MKKIILLSLLSVLMFSCNRQHTDDILQYVNPFIGTGGHGHTYPGATSPFGMVQLSPDTRLSGWDGCSGYHYSDSAIYGFSHTHLSGTGVSDYGDILLMPVSGKAVFKNTAYASPFSHQNETAEAGYYSVVLDKHNIKVELTTSPRTGMHRYTFSKTTTNKVILDLNHRDKVLEAHIRRINDSTIAGYRISQAWAEKQYVYFYMQFSQPIDTLKIASDDSIFVTSERTSTDIISAIIFNSIPDKSLLIKIGLSAVDIEGAKKNLETENPGWDFDAFKQKNQTAWRKTLSKIEITDTNKTRKTIFYTALYHTMIVPNLFSDVDGRYRGMDKEIHNSNFLQYTVFSLWDTYRATHPLYTILEPQRTTDFIHTFKHQYDDGKILPIWELAGNYTSCMIGYHAIPVIADAYFKNLTDIPADTLLEMMLTSANQDKLGLKAYKKNGYISISDDAESISKTLEYAYDDWCIAQVAKASGNDSIYAEFTRRAQSYKNCFDTQTGYMRPKLNETWKAPFNPSEVDFNYTEANAWQYSFYVPQDIYTLIEMMGGNKAFETQLDSLFTISSETTGRKQSDITGLIGQYAHGNEPSHHMAYLYDYVNKPEKTQCYVQEIVDKLYNNTPNGLCGNEDCGQMSAWYIFSTMGFYPVNPANGEYVFGKPFFDKITIHLENNKTFTIERQGEKTPSGVVKSILLNGKLYKKAYISHSDIMQGGSLVFVTDKSQSIHFSETNLPHSQITDNLITPVPSIRSAKRSFRDSTIVKIEAQKNTTVLYSINHSAEQTYSKPFIIKKTTTLTMRAVKDSLSSKTVEARFYKIPFGRKITLFTRWHPQYSAGGNDALIDGLKGTMNFRTGSWQGYYYDDLKAVVDLGKPIYSTKITMSFIQDAHSWIWLPEYVEFWGSTDSSYFFPLGKVENDVSKQDYTVQIKPFITQFYPKKIRYIKVFAKNHIRCPKGHPGENEKGFIFCDEITVE